MQSLQNIPEEVYFMGGKEPDTTEWLSLAQRSFYYLSIYF